VYHPHIFKIQKEVIPFQRFSGLRYLFVFLLGETGFGGGALRKSFFNWAITVLVLKTLSDTAKKMKLFFIKGGDLKLKN